MKSVQLARGMKVKKRINLTAALSIFTAILLIIFLYSLQQ